MMFGMRKASGIDALAFALVAAGGCIALALASVDASNASQAQIEIVSESDTELTMRFTRADGWHQMIEFHREVAEDVWHADVSPYPRSGIVWGNDEPTFASTSELRASGISAREAVGTFDVSIVDRPLDDLTVYRTYGKNIVVALWQEGRITEIYYVGDMVNNLLDRLDNDSDDSIAEVALRLCCQTDDVPRGIGGASVDEFPMLNVDACESIVMHGDDMQKSAACECLVNACQFCFDDEDLCNLLESAGVPIYEMRSQTCATGTMCYEVDDAREKTLHPRSEVLGEILNRVQVVHDIDQDN